jgi:glutamyl-tRNA synthetase
MRAYRGRIAPSPTGLLHIGHARTFWTAYERCKAAGGTLVLRNEDLDPARARQEYVDAFLEDLHWLGIIWQEGPDVGGPHNYYEQSRRMDFYRAAFQTLRANGWIYPCVCSRQDVLRALAAPHAGEEEPVYPGTCRPVTLQPGIQTERLVNWRFRVPENAVVRFHDRNMGWREYLAGRDFGDFVVWRHDQVPSYQLAVVVDDAAMGITEVVRGADLLVSTARQLLLYKALELTPPHFYHCQLILDPNGKRLAKRHNSLSLRALRACGYTPVQILTLPLEQFYNCCTSQGFGANA